MKAIIPLAGKGTRLLFVTVDGRQKPYSDGMTLRELASLMLALGARDALNLDGGGSSCMLVNGKETIRPSDKEGQRAVPAAMVWKVKGER